MCKLVFHSAMVSVKAVFFAADLDLKVPKVIKGLKVFKVQVRRKKKLPYGQ